MINFCIGSNAGIFCFEIKSFINQINILQVQALTSETSDATSDTVTLETN